MTNLTCQLVSTHNGVPLADVQTVFRFQTKPFEARGRLVREAAAALLKHIPPHARKMRAENSNKTKGK
jgi:hypothetical protein